jgi:hypothetical protein
MDNRIPIQVELKEQQQEIQYLVMKSLVPKPNKLR